MRRTTTRGRHRGRGPPTGRISRAARPGSSCRGPRRTRTGSGRRRSRGPRPARTAVEMHEGLMARPRETLTRSAICVVAVKVGRSGHELSPQSAPSPASFADGSSGTPGHWSVGWPAQVPHEVPLVGRMAVAAALPRLWRGGCGEELCAAAARPCSAGLSSGLAMPVSGGVGWVALTWFAGSLGTRTWVGSGQGWCSWSRRARTSRPAWRPAAAVIAPARGSWKVVSMP